MAIPSSGKADRGTKRRGHTRGVRTVNIHEAKTQLSRLLKAVAEGDEVIVASAGKPIARLVPYRAERQKRPLGVARGAFTVSDDAFAPLTPQELALFEGPGAAEHPPPIRGR